ncbi:MAG TPA: LuxR C-terminal-related transcriptional regulator [Anaerolineaceae bacterium]|nr:LuxR C-terminal-related transcriptional regulator [Anaerolineaceae bacterium]
MSDLLLASKVHVPPLHGNLVNRANLVARLNDGLARGCRLTLVSAPAGYGKSTLLSEWRTQADLPVAWLSLEKSENTPARFWTYFVAALNTLAQVQQFNLGSAILQASRTPQSESMEVPITELINQLSTLREPICLVLDDLHTLSESQIHQDLTFLIEHLPQTAQSLHLVAISRMDPPWPLARWRARGELNELRATDLRFGYDETGQFLQGALQFKLSPQEISALQDRTEGWIAGLQMAAISMQARLKAQGPESVSSFIKTFSGSNRFILDYLLDEVISQQSEEVRDFLFETSILDQLSASLCDAVIDKPGSQAFLDQLERTNLFLIPLDEEQRWYRYHNLFAEFSRKQIKQLLPERIPQLHQRASDWYAENHMPSEAIHHALAARDIDRVHQAVAGNALAMVENTELFDVLRHFEALPAHQVSSNPWLCMAYAWAKAYADPSTGMNDLLQQAEAALTSVEKDSEKRHLTSHLAAIRAYLAWMKGEAELALDFVQHALENLPEEDWAALTHLLNIKGLALQYRGDFLEATRSFEAALAAGQKIGRVHEILYTSGNLAYVHLLQSHLHEAFSICQTAVCKIEEAGQSSQRYPVLANAHATKSNILLEWNEIESAVVSARCGVALAEQWRQTDSLHFALSCLSEALGAAGAFEEAFEVNQRAMQVAGTISPWYARISAENEILLLLAKGDVLPAANKFKGCFPIFEEDKNKKPLFMEVSLLYQQNLFLDVINVLDGTLDDLQKKGWNLFWIKLMPMYALSLQALGRTEEALEVLERCLAAAEPEGFIRIFVDRGLPMASLLKRLRSRGVKVVYTTKLLAAFNSPEEAPKPGRTGSTPLRSAGVALMEPLSERELDVLRFLNSHLGVPEIAREMLIAPSTLRTHIRNIYLKLNVHGRLEALQKARDLGLF